MKNLFLLIIFATALGSCKKNTESTGVEVIITNASTENFKSLKIGIGHEEFNFVDVAAGATQTFNVKETYRYFYIKAVTDQDELVIQPIDFVGETLITNGKLAFDLKINTVNDQRRLDLIRKQ